MAMPARDRRPADEDAGQRLRRIRQLNRMTPAQLAQALGKARSYIYNLEGGHKTIHPLLAAQLAEVLHVPVTTFLPIETPTTLVPVDEQVPA